LFTLFSQTSKADLTWEGELPSVSLLTPISRFDMPMSLLSSSTVVYASTVRRLLKAFCTLVGAGSGGFSLRTPASLMTSSSLTPSQWSFFMKPSMVPGIRIFLPSVRTMQSRSSFMDLPLSRFAPSTNSLCLSTGSEKTFSMSAVASTSLSDLYLFSESFCLLRLSLAHASRALSILFLMSPGL